jgi:hypothetical protein
MRATDAILRLTGGSEHTWHVVDHHRAEQLEETSESVLVDLLPTLGTSSLFALALDHLTFIPTAAERRHFIDRVAATAVRALEMFGDSSEWGSREKHLWLSWCESF